MDLLRLLHSSSGMPRAMEEEVVENVTVLMDACERSDRNRVKELLASNRVSVQDRDSTGKTALHYAAENAPRELIALLLDADAHLIDAADNTGYTPLHLAVIAGNGPAVEFLVERGAEVNRVDGMKHSTVHWATVLGFQDILDYLLRKQALPSTPDVYGAHALHYATQLCGGTEARLGREVLKTLLAHSANLNCGDYDERTPMLWAASSGAKDAVDLLLKGGAEARTVDKDGLSALHCAASRGHSHVIAALLRSSPDYPVDPRDRNGYTPLVYAVSLGHIDCAKLLLHSSANPNHQDKKLRSPAHCAAAKGQLGTLKLLQQGGGSLRLENRRGDLPLHEAIHAGNTELVRWLISVHPDTLNASNYEGRTGLHLAAGNGDTEMMRLLLDKGADADALMLINGELRTPLDVAEERGEGSAVQALRDLDAHAALELPEAHLTNVRRVLEVRAERIVEVSSSSDESKSTRRGRAASEKSRSTTAKPRKDSARRRHSSKKTKKASPKQDSDDTEPSYHPASSVSTQAMISPPEYLRVQPAPSRLNFGALGSGTERSEYPSISSTQMLRVDGRGTKARIAEEKRIFQELAALKRMQLQHGRAQEEALVKRLVATYAKGHHFLPSDFQFQSFGTWEKFLYDQLKHLYQEEQTELKRQRRAEALSTDRSFHFGGRSGVGRKAGAKVDRLMKTYGVSPLPINGQGNRRAK